jgi:hypothetical protein
VLPVNAAVVFPLPVAPGSLPPHELAGLELKQAVVRSQRPASRVARKPAGGKKAASVLQAAESYLK